MIAQVSRRARTPTGRRGRILPGRGLSDDLGEHWHRHGPIIDITETPGWERTLIESIERSGLRGRGGAEFPTATKIAAVRAVSRRAIVVANGTEGEPASYKDRVLLSQAPHLVIDGLVLLTTALAAEEAILVVHRDVRASVDAAMAERVARCDDEPRLRVCTAAEGFVAGEASAVVNLINTGHPLPLGKAPRMSVRGVRRRPTLVQNVETLAHVAMIARHGAGWFRELGTDDEPGTALVTLDGAVRFPGVYETEIGVPITDLLQVAGGPTQPLQALLVGGYLGRWVGYEEAYARHYSSAGLGVSIGAGYVGAFPADACGLVQTARLTEYLASQSAGQCGPCVYGLGAVAGQVASLAHDGAVDFDSLHRWLGEIPKRGACNHPDGVVAHVQSALRVFAADVEQHVGGRCQARTSEPVFVVPAG